MVTRVHEAMHGSIMAYVSGDLGAMGLLPGVDFAAFRSANYAHGREPAVKEAAWRTAAVVEAG